MTKYDAKISGSLLVQLENHTSFLKFYGHFRVSDLNLIIYRIHYGIKFYKTISIA